ncbi:MAG: alpha/beta hydrolase, partial [Draconibacterium sp.]|nr:alpha/beta hydrolase [Draconibacterium sp.]
MKTLQIIGKVLSWIVALLILLFSIATFMGKSYLQTFTLVLMAVTIIWWPAFLSNKWNKTVSLISRVGFVFILLIVNIVVFKPEPKNSIYFSENHKNELYTEYDKLQASWPEDIEDIFIDAEFGKVHVLACGKRENPPLMMIHAASMGAHSWFENLESLLDHYRIYSFDNIGEGNKSELKDALVFAKNGKEVADFYALLADSLEIESCPVFGASNGGFIAQNYTFYYPERVESLALFGPMGLTQLSAKSFALLSVASMYPFEFIRNYVTKWALGTNEYVNQKYGEWFEYILKGTMPSIAPPVPMTTEQKQQMDLPVLLFLGIKDAIVGDTEFAKETAKEYPNIPIEVLESGHLIAVEHANYV